jgi:hypothetical protein
MCGKVITTAKEIPVTERKSLQIQRKTIKITTLVERTNFMLANSTCSRIERQAVAMFAESILMDAGQYRGWSNLIQSEVPAGEAPGINFRDRAEYAAENDLTSDEAYKMQFENTDDTRRSYNAPPLIDKLK